MDWTLIGIALTIIGIFVGLIYSKRFMLPELRFLEPDPRDCNRGRWWHVPVVIDEPDSWIISQFTKRNIVDCEVNIIIQDFLSPVLQMHWETDNPRGSRRITLRYRRREIIPVAIRAIQPWCVYATLSLEKGEAFISDMNFVHHMVKALPARLVPNKEYSVIIRLTSAEHSGWQPEQRYTLHVPAEGDSSTAFKLISV